MSIKLITGKPGGGKGVAQMNYLHQCIKDSDDCILTDFAVEKWPWVNGIFVPQVGYLSGLYKHCGKTFDAEDRIFRITPEAAAEFFLYRIVPAEVENIPNARLVTYEDGLMSLAEWQSHKKFRLWKTDAMTMKMKDGSQRIVDFSFDLYSYSGGMTIAIDECWKHWGARNWQNTGEGLISYAKQHRKVADTVWLMTQSVKDIDSIIVRVVQLFYHCKNRGKLKLWKFSQPKDIKVFISESPVTGARGELLQGKDTFTIDWLCQAFDTTSGTGLKGRAKGDLKEKNKGIPFWVLWVFIPSVGMLIWYLFTHVFTHVVGHVVAPVQHRSQSEVASNAVAYFHHAGEGMFPFLKTTDKLTNDADFVSRRDFVSASSYSQSMEPLVRYDGGSPDETNSVHCIGYVIFPDGQKLVYFDNGWIADSLEDSVTYISHRWVVCWGRRYRVVSRVYQRDSELTVGTIPVNNHFESFPSSVSVVPSVEILPSIHSAASALQPAVQLNGIRSGDSIVSQRMSAQ